MANEFGDVELAGKSYRIELASYRANDIVDFSPRASTPGGSILQSQLGLYQPLYITDWRHGFGHPWFDDAQSYMYTTGSVDTRMPGIVMLYTASQLVTQAAIANLAVNGGFIVWANTLFAWGSNGLWQYTGIAYNAGWTQIDTGTIIFALATAPALYYGRAGGRIRRYKGVSGIGVTISNASPAVLTKAGHGLIAGDSITLTTTGALPTGLVAGGTYFVIAAGLTANAFEVSLTLGGAAINTSSAGSGVHTYQIWAGTPTAIDVSWGIMSGGRMWFGEAGTSRVHHDNDDAALAGLEGGAGDTDLVYIGAGGYPTIGAANYAGKLYIFRTDGVFNLDTQSLIATKVLDFFDQVSSTNFRSWGVHNGFLVFPIRDRIYQWNGVRLADITPPQITDRFPYVTYGRFDNFCVVGRFLYCTARDSVSPWNEDLLCFDGVGWVKLSRLLTATAAGTVSAMNYDVVNNRLWIQVDDATDFVSAIQFQDLSEYPFSNFPITGTHSVVSSRLDMGFRRVVKSSPSLLVEASNLTATQYLLIYYSLDGVTFWPWGITAGSTNKVSVTGVTELKDPLGGGSGHSTVEYKFMVIRVDLITASAAQTPVLESLTLRFLMRPDLAFGYSFNIIVAAGNNYGGRPDTRTEAALIADLHTARDSKKPISFFDIFGVEHQVYMSSIQEHALERHSRSNEGGKPSIEHVVQVNLVEVS